MQKFNVTDNKREKSQKSSKSTSDAPMNKNWFCTFKKSLGNRKNRTKSSDDKMKNPSTRNNMISGQNIDLKVFGGSNPSTDDVDVSNFSNQFLDSFVKNSSFFNDKLKSKLKTYHNKQNVSKHQMDDFLNSMISNLLEPRSIEKVLMLVVEDYINSTCEKMLQDKMRSVYKKIESWTKHPLARPGFKKVDVVAGGNITNPEKHFIVEKISKLNKWENIPHNSGNQRRRVNIQTSQQDPNDVHCSTKTNSIACEKVNGLRILRNCFMSNAFIDPHKPSLDKFRNTESINIRSFRHNEKDKIAATTADHSNKWRDNHAPKKCVNSTKPCQNKPKSKSKLFRNETLLSEFSESKSNIDSENSKLTSIEPREMSVCKYSQQSKYTNLQEPPKDEPNHYKFLKISNIVNVDIKPSGEKDGEKLFSRIPTYCSKLKVEKPNVPEPTDKDRNLSAMCAFHTMKNKDISLHRIIRPKIRRSVTFVEPQKGSTLNSPLSKESGFCSQWEVRSEISKSGFLTSTKSDEFNYLISSNSSIQELCDNHGDNPGSFMTHSSKTTHPIRVPQSSISNDVSNISDTIKNTETECCTTIPKQEPQENNPLSPIIISMQSTPSFLGDIRYPYGRECSPEYSVSNMTARKKPNIDKLDSHSDTNNSIEYSENIFNMLKLDSNRMVPRNDHSRSTIDIIPNSKNYSIIEIVNKNPFSVLPYGDDSKRHWRKDKVKPSTFTTQLESVNSSCESSITDGDVLITTGSTKSKSYSRPMPNLQEILLSEEDDTCRNPKSFSTERKHVWNTQMKTANFSSSFRTEETKMNIESILKRMSPCYLSLSHNPRDNNIINSTYYNVDQGNSDDSKNLDVAELRSNRKDKNNNILKHTVASKQKMRKKVQNKTTQERQPMKFSRGIDRIF